MQPMLKSCPVSHLTFFPHEKDTLSHLSTDCREVQVQRWELPFNTDHKVPFDCFYTGVGTGQGFGTHEGTRQKQRPFCSGTGVTDVSAVTFCSRYVDVTSCGVCELSCPAVLGDSMAVRVTRRSLQWQQCTEAQNKPQGLVCSHWVCL